MLSGDCAALLRCCVRFELPQEIVLLVFELRKLRVRQGPRFSPARLLGLELLPDIRERSAGSACGTALMHHLESK